MQNQNSVEYLEKIKVKIFENLKETTFVPSVELQDIPRISFGMDDEDDAMLDDADEDENPDVRMTRRKLDETTEASGELSDSEDEDSDFLGPKGKKTTSGRRNEMNFKETGSGLSDIDETGSRSSGRSPSPKSNANESDVEDIEMKDMGDVNDLEVEEQANGASDKDELSRSKTSSKHSTEAPDHPESPERAETEKVDPSMEEKAKDSEPEIVQVHVAIEEEEETSSK